MTRVLILIPGLAGLVIVGNAANYYRGVDSFAFGITVVMALALIAGIIELLARATRVKGLSRELTGISDKADKEPPKNLDGISRGLRAILRSHLERDPMPTRAPLFTPYLIGLLVMLGLLGTFLGLFETLRGAREALSTSADVDALRAGLSTPMAGLMRSFGTSAAGVACSAMLGLAAVFARRSARALDTTVHYACSHGLSHLSAAKRQLVALVALAEQGESLPAAANALRDAVEQLQAIREEAKTERIEARDQSVAHASKIAGALEAEVGKVGERFLALEGSLREVHNETLLATRAENESIASESRQARVEAAKELSQASASLSEGLGDATKSLREGWTELAGSFDSAQAAGRDEFRTRADALVERIATLEAAWREGHEAATLSVRRIMVEGISEASKAASETVEPTVARIVEATERSASAHLEALRTQLDAEGTARRESDSETLQALRTHVLEVESLLNQARASRNEADEASVLRLGEHLAITLERLDGAAQARATSDGSLLEEIRLHVGELHSNADIQAAQRVTSDESLLESVRRHVGELQSKAEAQASQRAIADAAILDEIRRHVGELQTSTQASANELTTGLTSVAVEWKSASAETAKRDEERAAGLGEVAARFEESLGRTAEAMLARMGAQESNDQRFAERQQEMVEHLRSAVENVSAAADAQVQNIAQFNEAGEVRGAQIETRASARVETLIEALSEATRVQAERLAAFEETLAQQQQTGAELLRQQLVSEARELGEGLSATGAMVREAAGLVQSGGAELSAAVELFSGSVEEHGQAAQRWLSGLSLVERSVEEAGEGAAVEILGQYLTRTHELFDQQLGFQQELFEQLRAARTPPEVVDA
jgi:hypothetical protein